MKDPSPPSPSETCPFCGKVFKRLKSHLPHCKVAVPTRNQSAPADRTGTARADSQISKTKRNVKECSSASLEKTGRSNNRKTKTGTPTEKVYNQKQLQGDNGSTTLQKHGGKDRRDTVGNKLTQIAERTQGDTKSRKTPSLSGLGFTGSRNILHSSGDLASSRYQEHFSVGLCSRASALQLLPGPDVKVALRTQDRMEGFRRDFVLEEQGPSDGKPNLVVQEQNTHPGTLHNQASSQTECAHWPVQEEPTIEIFLGKGDILTDGKTPVLGHLEESQCGKSHSEKWSEVLKQSSMVSQISTPCTLDQERQGEHLFEDTSAVHIEPPGAFLLALGSGDKTLGRTERPIARDNRPLSDLTSKSSMDAVTSLGIGDVPPARNAGMEWIPELYPNYIHMRVVPGLEDVWSTEKTTVWVDKSEENQPDIPLPSKRLMDVRLGELQTWATGRRFPFQSLSRAVQRASWERYYNKSINVRRGGVGGLAMLLAGYCILSYAWNYNHIKEDRRKRNH